MSFRSFRFSFLMMFSVFVFAFSPPLMAEEPVAEEGTFSKDQEEINKEKAEALAEQNRKLLEQREKASGEIYARIRKVVENLEGQETKHFFLTYSNYNMIETVKMVQRDVGKAIAGCSDNNPDMKSELEAGKKKWETDLTPLVKEAEGNLENMILAQDYASRDQLQEIFNAIDESRDPKNSPFEKIPVTTEDACTYLLGKMDETRESMLSLVRSTLVTFPQAFPNTEPSAAP